MMIILTTHERFAFYDFITPDMPSDSSKRNQRDHPRLKDLKERHIEKSLRKVEEVARSWKVMRTSEEPYGLSVKRRGQ